MTATKEDRGVGNLTAVQVWAFIIVIEWMQIVFLLVAMNSDRHFPDWVVFAPFLAVPAMIPVFMACQIAMLLLYVIGYIFLCMRILVLKAGNGILGRLKR